MIKLLMLLLCLRISAEKHCLTFYFTGSSGLPNEPEFEVVVEVDGSPIACCNGTEISSKQDWVKRFLDDDTDLHTWLRIQCFQNLRKVFEARISDLKQSFKQPEGVHVFQWIDSCDWNKETGEHTGFMQYGYNGEDFIALDIQTMSWIALKQQAIPIKVGWDTDKARKYFNQKFLTEMCPDWLKRFLDYGKSSLLRTELPSVSFLQKTSSSPIRCHATGFYPERAVLFWRKDGEEIHEFVDYGEIIPNNDGTFQMSVDFSVSSVSVADWWKYDCVFQHLDVEDKIILRLDEAEIRTNSKRPSNISLPIIAAVIGSLVLVSISAAAAAYVAYKKKIGEQLGFCVWD
uniref:Major histocompatibility complex class I-related gene protein-like n=1 Tax=Fundulus heteroclitus TaxID=8078 RepID=A0A3Q2Q0Z5_FUNHE